MFRNNYIMNNSSPGSTPYHNYAPLSLAPHRQYSTPVPVYMSTGTPVYHQAIHTPVLNQTSQVFHHPAYLFIPQPEWQVAPPRSYEEATTNNVDPPDIDTDNGQQSQPSQSTNERHSAQQLKYRRILAYLRDKQLPTNPTERNNMIRDSKCFTYRNGKLYHRQEIEKKIVTLKDNINFDFANLQEGIDYDIVTVKD